MTKIKELKQEDVKVEDVKATETESVEVLKAEIELLKASVKELEARLKLENTLLVQETNEKLAYKRNSVIYAEAVEKLQAQIAELTAK